MDIASLTLGGLLAERAAELGDKTYLFFGDETCSYAELDRRVDRVAVALRALGVRRGSHVNVHFGNRPEFVELFFAAARIGAVLNPTNLALGPAELAYIVDHADAEWCFTEPSFAAAIREIQPQCPRLRSLVLLDGAAAPAGGCEGFLSWDDLLARADAEIASGSPPVAAEAPPTPQDDVAILYTSGTTARPKGVLLSHRNILAAGHSWMWLVDFTANDRTMTGLPLFHANGLFFSCVGSMIFGGSFVLLPRFTPTSYLELARRYGATHFNFAGPAMAIMLQRPPSPDDRDHPVRVVHNAMGSPELIERWAERFGISPVMIYNLTECALATGTPLRGPHPVKLGSIGWPAPSLPSPTEVRIVDETGAEAPPGVVGEIVVRGPALTRGYYKDSENTRAAIRDGWLHTGDGGYRDPDGCMWYADRIKDMIKPKGENVASVEVEDALTQHPKVVEAGVIGVMDELTGEEIKASVRLADGESRDTVPPAELSAWCRERLAGFKVPRYFEYRDRPLPRGLGGAKILKRELRIEKANPIAGCWDRRTQTWIE